MACVAVLSLVRTLELEFLDSHHPRPILQHCEIISCTKELVQSLHRKLGLLMEALDESRMDGVEEIKVLERILRDVAFGVEDEIELQIVQLVAERPQGETDEERMILHQCRRMMGKTHPCRRFRRVLQQAIGDIDAIQKELVKIKNDYTSNPDQDIMMGDSSQHASHSKDLMVGKQGEIETIFELLIQRAPHQQKVVSIKGMAGIGKTTLARKLYEDSSIVSHFDKRAWVVASQHHNKRQMLVDLLTSMGRNAESGSDEDLALRLRQGLLGQRYLVVIDDIWSTEAWDDVKLCFPDNGDGSRVLLTTRLEEVANYTHSNNGFSHQMNFLDQSESWNLFCEKELLKGVEFETIARPIVEKCNGLPLAIVVAAGMFSKLITLEEWKYVAKALNSSGATTIAESCSRILSFSYNHLPHNLKACFLYLGVFPEDYEIYASKLARLWAAEGLVKAFQNESFEVVARKYIQELSDRNLILVRMRSSNGRRIKVFQIHDVLHAFCVREAQNENLLKVVGGNCLNFYPRDFRWLRIQSTGFDVQTLPSSSKTYRSIFYFQDVEVGDLNLQKFNLLRLLYLDSVKLVTLGFSKVVPPLHLRYLSVQDIGSINSIQLSLSNNLQTFSCIKQRMPNCLDFPHLRYYRGYRGWQHIYPPKFVHQNLQSILWISFSSCTKELFTKIPYLKKLKVDIVEEVTDVDIIGGIGNFFYLQQLERLKIIQFNYPLLGGHLICTQIALLKNLKMLTLWGMMFRWEEINVLSMLPKLEVLKLLMGACQGQKWTLREEQKFCELVVLELSQLDLKHWEVNADHFPKLERLLIDVCYELKEIPSSFSEISTLKSIELRGCYSSLVTSAKQIQEEQHELGNYNMVVIEKYAPQKVVIKLEGKKSKAWQIVCKFPGVYKASLEGEDKDKLVVIGVLGFDAGELLRKLRDEVGGAYIKSDDQE